MRIKQDVRIPNRLSREEIMADHIDGPLHWEQLGKHGPPMAFVHPNPMDHSCWLYQMAHFSTWFRTIGIDLPGYGRSPTARKGLQLADIAQACWEAIDAMTDEAAVLVGLSIGSAVVPHMAVQRPERTRALILSGTGYRPVRDFAVRLAAQYREHGIGFRRQHVLNDFSPAFRETEMGQYFADLFTQRNGRADVETIIEMYRAVGQPDPPTLHDDVRAPTLIITGSEDSAHPSAFRLQERLRDCELVTIQGAGHACNMERPWEYDAHMLGFLTRRGLVETDRQRDD